MSTSSAIRFWRVRDPRTGERPTYFDRKQDALAASAKLRAAGALPVVTEFWMGGLRKCDVVYALNNWPVE